MEIDLPDKPEVDTLDQLMDQFVEVDGIGRVKHTPEDTRQNKPAVLVLAPAENIEEGDLEAIGARAREVVKRVLDTDVVASVEYPVSVGGEGRPVAQRDEPLVKLRWRVATSGTLSDTRLNGYKIEEGIPGEVG